MDHIIEGFKKLPTAAVSDAIDKIGMEGACFGINPLSRNYRIVARAYTLKYEPVEVNKGTVGDFIDEVTEEQVIVIDNAGRLNCTVWGDILTSVAHRRGIPGVVINGVCRDVAHSLKLELPIFSKGKYMRTGKDRVQLQAVNVPISLGDIRVNPGDILVCDADGVVVVPQELEEKVLTIAQQIDEAETKIRKDAEEGMSLADARAKHKYHDLQKR
ncbi:MULTISPECIES: RraA family protein [unclassified Paenibacillus]|uniref:RraA family protein n=1 Tax=unclassified Paenibacillus TaxID=185978 RepID=UPI001AEB74FC|nr:MULTISPECIES: RraA family protein [unclassified Paenibacillus]MBP1155409.1 regulator of RNase E activity RraA [Paenibacillus sp. PvP091]MBP1169206.1 regulator of RNase E activity RraA [Paenibacillus sp. PvR098]MBP2440234.1 regulator of RNase E activity RraA [Paenibacillus sp. PvP052]